MASGRKPSARVRFFQEKVFDGERIDSMRAEGEHIDSMRAEGAATALNVSSGDLDGPASVEHVQSETIVLAGKHLFY